MTVLLAAVFLTAWLALPLALMWFIIDGLKTGVLRGRGAIARTENPILYWMILLVFGGVIAFQLWCTVDIVRHGWL